MRTICTALAQRTDRPVADLAVDEGEAPAEQLRELAGDYEAGEVEGLIVTYVMKNGAVGYKLMGALGEEENLGNVATIVGELQRRIHMRIAFSS